MLLADIVLSPQSRHTRCHTAVFARLAHSLACVYLRPFLHRVRAAEVLTRIAAGAHCVTWSLIGTLWLCGASGCADVAHPHVLCG